jgi:hypothetical protein
MTRRTGARGAILTFIGAYLAGTGLMGTIYLVQHGAAHKAGTFVAFLIGGVATIVLGHFVGARTAASPEPAPPPAPKAGGDWMRSQPVANATPPLHPAVAPTAVSRDDSPSPRRSLSTYTVALLVGLAAALIPYLLPFVFRSLSFISSLLPQSHGRSAMRWIMPGAMVLLVVWAITRGIHNAGLRWNVAADRRYMALYALRLLVAFGLFAFICALPWMLLASSHPNEGTMTVIGWAGILWMPVIMAIAGFIAVKLIRVWTISRD